MAKQTEKRGRPLSGRDQAGNAVASSQSYPQLTIRVPPEIKTEIDALKYVEQRTQAEVVEAAIRAYVQSLSPTLRQKVADARAIRAGSEKR